MADNITGLTVAQLQEIKKWLDMGYSQGQVAKKTGHPPRKISSASRFLKGRTHL